MSSAERTRAVGLAGALLGLACVLGLVEAALVPQLPLPGVRVGLANIAVLVAAVTVGLRWALAVSLGRVAIVGLATGTLGGPATLLAASGAVAAWLAIAVLSRSRAGFSVVGWSVGAAAAHVLAQIAIASLVVGDLAVVLVAPYSLTAGAICGLFIGMLTRTLLSRARTPLTTGVSLVRREGAHGAATGR